MSNVLNKTILSDGTQKAVMHFYLESDGVGGEFNNEVLIDPYVDFSVLPTEQRDPDYDGPGLVGHVEIFNLTILQVWSATAWFDFKLSWDASPPVPFFVWARDSEFKIDMRHFSGMQPAKFDLNEPTGKILITTSNFAPLGSAGMIIIEFRKN